METHDDMTLVRLFQEGDDRAFPEIVRRYRLRMFAIASRIIRSQCDVEEVVADTFIRAWKALGQFRGGCKFSTWLIGICRNCTFSRLKHLQYRSRGLVPLDAPIGDTTLLVADTIAAEAPSAGDEAEHGEFAMRLWGKMSHLSSDHREILVLRAVHDQSYEQIAETRSLKVGTVKSQLNRAREDLRRRVNCEAA